MQKHCSQPVIVTLFHTLPFFFYINNNNNISVLYSATSALHVISALTPYYPQPCPVSVSWMVGWLDGFETTEVINGILNLHCTYTALQRTRRAY